MGRRLPPLNAIRAFEAAARHLQELHTTFGGDWALSIAAYNSGGYLYKLPIPPSAGSNGKPGGELVAVTARPRHKTRIPVAAL